MSKLLPKQYFFLKFFGKSSILSIEGFVLIRQKTLTTDSTSDKLVKYYRVLWIGILGHIWVVDGAIEWKRYSQPVWHSSSPITLLAKAWSICGPLTGYLIAIIISPCLTLSLESHLQLISKWQIMLVPIPHPHNPRSNTKLSVTGEIFPLRGELFNKVGLGVTLIHRCCSI